MVAWKGRARSGEYFRCQGPLFKPYFLLRIADLNCPLRRVFQRDAVRVKNVDSVTEFEVTGCPLLLLLKVWSWVCKTSLYDVLARQLGDILKLRHDQVILHWIWPFTQGWGQILRSHFLFIINGNNFRIRKLLKYWKGVEFGRLLMKHGVVGFRRKIRIWIICSLASSSLGVWIWTVDAEEIGLLIF